MIAFPAHWYYPNGEPCHEVPKKDGSGMKAVTVEEALALGLRPSSTNILDALNKYGLTDYKITNSTRAGVIVGQGDPSGDVDKLTEQAIEEGEELSFETSGFGKRLHAAIAGGPRTTDLLAYLTPFEAWCRSKGLERISAERPVVGQDYGGTYDWYGYIHSMGSERWLLDWTTQRTKPKNAVKFYPEKGAQLASYAATFAPHPRIATVLISHTEPGRIEWKEWDFDIYWDAFEKVKAAYYSALGRGYRLKNTAQLIGATR